MLGSPEDRKRPGDGWQVQSGLEETKGRSAWVQQTRNKGLCLQVGDPAPTATLLFSSCSTALQSG